MIRTSSHCLLPTSGSMKPRTSAASSRNLEHSVSSQLVESLETDHCRQFTKPPTTTTIEDPEDNRLRRKCERSSIRWSEREEGQRVMDARKGCRRSRLRHPNDDAKHVFPPDNRILDSASQWRGRRQDGLSGPDEVRGRVTKYQSTHSGAAQGRHQPRNAQS